MLSVEAGLTPGSPLRMNPLLDAFRRWRMPHGVDPVPPHPFDLAHGTDTGGLLRPEQLRTRHPESLDSSAYYAMSPSRFRTAIELWKATPPPFPVEEYSFLDLGCGKGRALLLATELPFRRAIGVELHGGLAGVARKNLRMWRKAGRARCPARVVTEDAAVVELPEGPCSSYQAIIRKRPCLLYLFHPFAGAAMARLVARLRGAMRDRPDGSLDVIYFNPEAGELWRDEPGVRLLWSRVLPMSDEDAAADPVAHEDDLCEAYRWGSEP